MRKSSPLKTGLSSIAIAAFACILTACGGSSSNLSSNSSDGGTSNSGGSDLLPLKHNPPVIEGVDTATSLTQDPDSDSTITAGQRSSIDIYGLNLRPDLKVKLGSSTCDLKNFSKFDDDESDDDRLQFTADCPQQSVGTVNLTVMDGTQQVYQTAINVQSASVAAQHLAFTKSLRPAFSPVVRPMLAQAGHPAAFARVMQSTGTAAATASTLVGKVEADVPTINVRTGGLDFSQIRTVPVRGVVVKALDADNGNAVLAVTATDEKGQYGFVNAPTGKNVIVEVSAQLAKTRSADNPNSAQYNFMVRDNTAAGTLKPLYTLAAAPVALAAGDNVVSLKASSGYDSNGQVVGPRQSAPFAILDVIYNAATGIESANASATLPDLNIYWSTNNINTNGDKLQGQVSTSHFASNGHYPGVYILGKADVDTDEFDRGVIGHEFGHYLQYAASYSDNPGGSHSSNEYKDASLAYGEGFGTAIGALLSQSKYYSDSSGARSAGGFSTDVSQPVPSGNAKGFYSEDSIAHVLYTIGVNYGFPTFWKTTASMAGGHESATIFNFINRFVDQNPSTRSDIASIARADNINMNDIYGDFPGDILVDSKIDSDASKGASDLEKLYLRMSVDSWSPSATTSANLTPRSPSFCFNGNLKGSMKSNGLGMSRRFTFVAPQTGTLGLKLRNPDGTSVAGEAILTEAREELGRKIDVYDWGTDIGRISVVAGKRYSVKVNLLNQSVLPPSGNTCGITLTAWNVV